MARLSVAAMQQIADWLKKFGMSEYADRFVENRIDLSVLQDLTDQHLRDGGIVLGDRRKRSEASDTHHVLQRLEPAAAHIDSGIREFGCIAHPDCGLYTPHFC